MRDRKLSDQTLPLKVKEAGTLVSPLGKSYDLDAAKSRGLCPQPRMIVLSCCAEPMRLPALRGWQPESER